MFNLSIKDYTVQAGTPLRLHIPGDFFQIMGATGPVNVDFIRASSRSGFAEGVGQGFRAGPLGEGFHGVEITSATTQTLKLCFSKGNSPVDLSQVVSVTGLVSVVDGAYQNVLDDAAFSGVAEFAATAAQFSHSILWNPTGSGKTLVVSRVNAFSVTGAARFKLAWTLDSSFTTVLNQGLSKLTGNPSAIAELRSGSGASSKTFGNFLFQNVQTDAANKTVDLLLNEPIVITPGAGLLVEAGAVNLHVNAVFQWLEKAI